MSSFIILSGSWRHSPRIWDIRNPANSHFPYFVFIISSYVHVYCEGGARAYNLYTNLLNEYEEALEESEWTGSKYTCMQF